MYRCICRCMCIYICLYIHICMIMYVCINVGMYECMYVWMNAWMYVWMNVCIYEYIYIYNYNYNIDSQWFSSTYQLGCTLKKLHKPSVLSWLFPLSRLKSETNHQLIKLVHLPIHPSIVSTQCKPSISNHVGSLNYILPWVNSWE